MEAASEQRLIEHLEANRPWSRTLPNGAKAVLQSDYRSDLVSIQIWMGSGSIHEDSLWGSGCSHFLEHLVFRGSERLEDGQAAAMAQALGAEINAYTSFDRTVYWMEGPSETADAMLEILADLVFAPKLGESAFKGERSVIQREIAMTQDDPDRTVLHSLLENAFTRNPLRFPVIGLPALFDQLSLQDIQNYHRERYSPGNTFIIAAGAIDPETFEHSLNSHLADREPRPVKVPYVPVEPVQLAARTTTGFADVQLCRGRIGFKIPSLRHPQAPAIDLLASVLGAGQSSLLRRELVENQQIVHTISATAWNPADPGLFLISYDCDPEKALEAESALFDLIDHLNPESIPDLAVEKAKRFALLGEIQARQTIGGTAARTGIAHAAIRDPEYPLRYLKELRAQTPESLLTIAKTVFQESKRTCARLLPLCHRPQSRAIFKPAAVGPFEEKQLNRGGHLIWQRDSSLPRVAFRITFRGGPLFENDREKGGTSLLASLLAQDTRFQTGQELHSALESNGIFFREFAGNNTFGLSIECMPDDCKIAIRTLHRALNDITFLPETFRREKQGQIAYLQDTLDSPLDKAQILLRKQFMRKHAFACSPLGDLSTLPEIGIPEIENLQRRLVHRANATLVVSGDFNEKELLPLLEELVTSLPVLPAGFTIPNESPPDLPACKVHVHSNSQQAIVLEAFEDPGAASHWNLTADFVDELLSDMSGPLFSEIRDKRSLAYFIGASRLSAFQFGMFSLYAGTRPDAAGEVLQAWQSPLEQLASGQFPSDLFTHARKRLLTQSRQQIQTLVGRNAVVAMNALLGRPLMHWKSLQSDLESCQPDQVARFVTRFLNPRHRIQFILSP